MKTLSMSVVCPSCAAKLRAPDAMAGRMVKCPKCGIAMPIPAREIAAPNRADDEDALERAALADAACKIIEPTGAAEPPQPLEETAKPPEEAAEKQMPRPGEDRASALVTSPLIRSRLPLWAWLVMGGEAVAFVASLVAWIVIASSGSREAAASRAEIKRLSAELATAKKPLPAEPDKTEERRREAEAKAETERKAEEERQRKAGTGKDKEPDKEPDKDKEAIGKFLTAYLKAPFADRVQFVTNPKEFEKTQEAYYEGKLLADEVRATAISVNAGPKADYLTVVARTEGTVAGMKFTQVLHYYLVHTKAGLKIDWSATVGHNPVGLKTWAAGTDDTISLRVEAQLDDYYNFQYRTAKTTHYSVRLVDQYGDRFDSFHGYVLKDSDLGKRLFEIVKDGQKHKLTVTIERTERPTSVVGITEVVSETWVK